jgi:hypothetical protein
MPYTLQLNGTTKRFDQTLVEMGLCMLHNKGLTMGESQATTTYLKNRSPNNFLEGVIPLEASNGEKPNVGHLKKISSMAFVHKPKELISKLDIKTTQGMFVEVI